MKEKNVTKISLSTFFLIFAIIAIIVMGVFIYKLNNDKNTEIQKSTALQSQVNSLNGTVTELQGKINNISNVINKTNESIDETNSKETQQNNFEKNSSTATSTSVSNSSKDSVSNKILGTWKAYEVVDSSGNDLGLYSIWGSGITYSNEMIFKENGVLSYMIGITASSDDGSYTVDGNTIKYGVPTDMEGELNWRTLTYIPEEDILKEELDWTGEIQIVTYVRAD